MVIPTLFSLRLNVAIRNSLSEPQSAPGLNFADYIDFLHLWLQRIYQSDFGIEHLVMSMCKVLSCVAGRGCLLWPVRSLGKTLLLLNNNLWQSLMLCIKKEPLWSSLLSQDNILRMVCLVREFLLWEWGWEEGMLLKIKRKWEGCRISKGFYFGRRPFIMSDVDSETGLKPINLSPKPEMK